MNCLLVKKLVFVALSNSTHTPNTCKHFRALQSTVWEKLGGLACCSPWCRKELDMMSNWTELTTGHRKPHQLFLYLSIKPGYSGVLIHSQVKSVISVIHIKGTIFKRVGCPWELAFNSYHMYSSIYPEDCSIFKKWNA